MCGKLLGDGMVRTAERLRDSMACHRQYHGMLSLAPLRDTEIYESWGFQDSTAPRTYSKIGKERQIRLSYHAGRQRHI